MYTHKVHSIKTKNDRLIIRNSGCHSSSNQYMIWPEDQEIFKEKNIHEGFEFKSEEPYFNTAMEQLLFGREITDVVAEIVVPAIIARTTPNTRGVDYDFIRKWYASENRIRRDPNNRWNLIADEWYDYINTLLSAEIRLSPLDGLPNIQVKGQCGYFKINYPDCVYYCALTGSNTVFEILEKKMH